MSKSNLSEIDDLLKHFLQIVTPLKSFPVERLEPGLLITLAAPSSDETLEHTSLFLIIDEHEKDFRLCAKVAEQPPVIGPWDYLVPGDAWEGRCLICIQADQTEVLHVDDIGNEACGRISAEVTSAVCKLYKDWSHGARRMAASPSVKEVSSSGAVLPRVPYMDSEDVLVYEEFKQAESAFMERLRRRYHEEFSADEESLHQWWEKMLKVAPHPRLLHARTSGAPVFARCSDAETARLAAASSTLRLELKEWQSYCSASFDPDKAEVTFYSPFIPEGHSLMVSLRNQTNGELLLLLVRESETSSVELRNNCTELKAGLPALKSTDASLELAAFLLRDS